MYYGAPSQYPGAYPAGGSSYGYGGSYGSGYGYGQPAATPMRGSYARPATSGYGYGSGSGYAGYEGARPESYTRPGRLGRPVHVRYLHPDEWCKTPSSYNQQASDAPAPRSISAAAPAPETQSRGMLNLFGGGKGGGGKGRGGKGRGKRNRKGKTSKRRRNRKPKPAPQDTNPPPKRIPVEKPTSTVPPSVTNPNRPGLTGDDHFDEAVQRCYNEVTAIMDQLRASGQKYDDPDFVKSTAGGDDSANVFLNEQGEAEWKRLSEICRNPSLFVAGSEPGDIIQGRLGSCYLLGGLSVMAVVDNLVERVFACHDIGMGIYGIMLYDTDQEAWTHVIIDDYVPCENNTPIYARCLDANEIWVSLLEKAYAKKGRDGVSNIYSNIAGGRPEAAMVHFSGGSAQVYMRDYHQNEFTHDFISDLTDTGRHLLAAGSYETKDGIYAGHAYGILDALTTDDGVDLVQLRNPWGHTEWTGPWGDSSSEMTPARRRELNHPDADDGTFFMSWDDFAAIFGDIGVLELPAGFTC